MERDARWEKVYFEIYKPEPTAEQFEMGVDFEKWTKYELTLTFNEMFYWAYEFVHDEIFKEDIWPSVEKMIFDRLVERIDERIALNEGRLSV